MVVLFTGCGEATPSQLASLPERVGPKPKTPIDPRLGDLSELSPEVRRAFDVGTEIAPLSVPGPDDWLTIHPESRQSVGVFWTANPHRPGADGRDAIYIAPFGEVPMIAELQAYAADYFGLRVEVLDPVDLRTLAVTRRSHAGTVQLLAPDLLAIARARLPRDAYAMIGLTQADLYPEEDWNFVFGLASAEDRVGVFSLHRYDPRFEDPTASADPTLLMERALKILTHEIGHMFGMLHCVHFACIMNGVNHIGELDRAPLHLCPVCLRKLHLLTGFDPAKRYESLTHRYREHGLEDAAAFVDRRLEWIRG